MSKETFLIFLSLVVIAILFPFTINFINPKKQDSSEFDTYRRY